MRRVFLSKTPVRMMANEYQGLGDRIKFLRSTMKPFMTQQQLADRSTVYVETIRKIEAKHPRTDNIQINTLKKIAHALDCELFVNIKKRSGSRPSSSPTEFPLEYPEAQPLPERTGRATGRGLKQALLNVRSYQKNYRRRAYHEQHKATSGTRDLGIPELDKDE